MKNKKKDKQHAIENSTNKSITKDEYGLSNKLLIEQIEIFDIYFFKK